MSAIKRAEENDDLIVRAYEVAGGPVTDSFNGLQVAAMAETDLQEQQVRDIEEIHFKPHEIKTMRIKLQEE